MVNKTPFLKMDMPDATEFYNVENVNANILKIDTGVSALSSQFNNLATVVDALADNVATITDKLCTLEITCAPPLQGKTITVTKGATVLSKTVGASLKVTYQLPELGTWSIYNPSTQKTETIKADYYGNYYFVANVYRVMTVNIDLENSNPATCCTYADDAVGMTAGSEAWDDFFGHYPVLFKNGVEVGKVKRTDFTKFEDGTPADITSGNAGDVMTAFPRRGLSIVTVGNTLTIKMTDNPDAPNFQYYAHERGAVNLGKFYLGAYKGFNLNGKLRSLSGKTPTTSQTIGTFRTQARANGTGYENSGFYQLTFRQAMYFLKYAHTNSQVAVGRGYVYGNTSAIVTGGTESKGMDWGEATGKQHMKLFGLEDFWGNVWELIDGIATDASRNVFTNTNNFQDNGKGDGYLTSVQTAAASDLNYMIRPYGTTKAGFVVKVSGGSETTYFSDAASLQGNCVARHGNYWRLDSGAGVPCLDMSQSASTTIVDIGGRLMFLGGA